MLSHWLLVRKEQSLCAALHGLHGCCVHVHHSYGIQQQGWDEVTQKRQVPVSDNFFESDLKWYGWGAQTGLHLEKLQLCCCAAKTGALCQTYKRSSLEIESREPGGTYSHLEWRTRRTLRMRGPSPQPPSRSRGPSPSAGQPSLISPSRASHPPPTLSRG